MSTFSSFLASTLRQEALNWHLQSEVFASTASVVMAGSAADETLIGGAGNDTIEGGDGTNFLVGGLGDDLMIGGAGSDLFEHYFLNHEPDSFALDRTKDTMVGGMGDDAYVVDHIEDVVTENVGEGQDLVRSFLAEYTMAAHVEDGAIAAYAVYDGASLTGNELDNRLWGNMGADTLSGGLGNDTVYARDGDDQVLGGEGNDALFGEEGNDTLVGGEGDDTLEGGDGINFLVGGKGSDLMVGGSGSDLFEQYYRADHPDAFALDRTIDTMVGGLGDDAYVVDHVGDIVVENVGQGEDLLRSFLSAYTLVANIENGAIGDFDGFFEGAKLTGNTLHNSLWGNAGADTMDGGSGNDTLYGRSGSDQLIGGLGNDLLLGEQGNDSLNGGSGADRMEGGIGNDTYNVDNVGDVVFENANEGTDTVVLSTLLTYTMAVNIENLSVSTSASALTLVGNTSNNSISGSNGNDTIRGEAGNDTLNGGAGNDSLVGGSGNDVLSGGTGADRMEGGTENDTYHVDNAADVVLENANAGTDTVVLSTLLTYTLAANVENLNVGTNASAFTLTGNLLNNTIAGGSGHDTIAGEAGNDSLLGGLGNDKLNGGTGDDRLSGGAGSDTLTGGSGADRFTFDAAFASTNLDTIEDFTKSQGDKIAVEDAVFTKLVGKTNLSTHFRLSTAASVGGDDFLVYNTATGQLFYDATGSSNNTSTMQLFATLSTKPLDLTGTDFVVI